MQLSKYQIHKILAHSYTFYFLSFLIGILLDYILPLRIFKHPIMPLVGGFIIVIASLLIFWAQKTSRDYKNREIVKEIFFQGPYKLSRSPTHWGLFLLIFGFGLLVNASFVVIFSVISLIITKVVFLKKEEMFLEKKYGEPYREYKKIVKF